MNDETLARNHPAHEGPGQAAVQPTLRRRALLNASYFISWLAYAAVTFWIVLEVRELAVVSGMLIRLNPWQVLALDRGVMVVAGLAWLVGTVVAEGYFRGGVAKGDLWRRVRRTFLVLLAAAALIVAANLATQFT